MPWTFDAPAGLTDFTKPDDWNTAMVGEADEIVAQLIGTILEKPPEDVSAAELATWAPQLAYVHPVREAVPGDAETVGVAPWGGFPRGVDRQAPWTTAFPPIEGDADGTLRAVEDLGEDDHAPGRFVDRHGNELKLPVRHRQDEYLEWVAKRDGDGNLTKITFVAEGYDYFRALFESDRKTVVELYQHLTEQSRIAASDLMSADGVYRVRSDGRKAKIVDPGGFNPRNRFNIDPGIVHLSHRANSLGAEINLAGVSALARKKADGTPVDGRDEEELLCCNEGGEPNRNSDPKISQQAYGLVQQGYRYTLANPVGLYIAAVDEASLTLPDGTPLPREWWNVVRGHDLWSGGTSRVLRLELRPPAGETAKLSDLSAGGSALRFPGQVARLLSVHLFVTRWKRAHPGVGPVVRCTGTCCRLTGTELLAPSRGGCGDGFELAFPGLVAAEPTQASARSADRLHALR